MNNSNAEGDASLNRRTSYNNPDLPRISGHLTDVMDRIGFSEEKRKGRVKLGVMWQMIENIRFMISLCGKMCGLRMGSSIEGTTAHGMGSDEDALFFSTSTKAYCNKDNTNQKLGLVLTRDETTPAGYTKLQPACQGRIINDATDNTLRHDAFRGINFREDSNGNVMVAHHTEFSEMGFPTNFSKHGPADTITNMPNAVDSDSVRSFLCGDIANGMEEWCVRDRKHDWPSKDTRDLFKTLGCFVVPVGHPSSPEKHLEWRMSFSLQERYLMWHLNTTQYQCFMLLKLMKTFFIKPRFGDVLTSYHCKTLLFYTIEKHEQGIWFPQNLISCLRMCLILLHKWISDKYIPNYFIPKENMFVKMEAALKGNYCNLKSCMAAAIDDWKFLFRIKFNAFGEQFLAKVNNKHTHVSISESIIRFTRKGSHIKYIFSSDCIAFMNEIQHVLDYFDIVLAVLQSTRTCTKYTTFDETIQHLYKQWFSGRSQTQDNPGQAHQLIQSHQFLVEEHERQPRLMAVKVWKSDLSTLLGSVLAARYFQTGNRQYLVDSVTYLERGKSLSAMASMLVKATVLLKQSLFESSDAVLNAAEELFKDRIFRCECYKHCIAFSVEGVRKQSHRNLKISLFSNVDGISNAYCESCLIFKRCEYDIVPESLAFEAYRSFGISARSLSPYEVFWVDSVVVDPVMYLYYLQFLSNQHNNPYAADVALHKFENTLFEKLRARHSSVLGHTDTWLNVLGDIFVKKGWTRLALRCFRYSDRIRPNHNAVRWHVMFLLFSPSDGVI